MTEKLGLKDISCLILCTLKVNPIPSFTQSLQPYITQSLKIITSHFTQPNPVTTQPNPVTAQSNPVTAQPNPVTTQHNPVNTVTTQPNPVSAQPNPVSA